MKENESIYSFDDSISEPRKTTKNKLGTKDILKHSLLFILTVLSVTFVGIFWVGHSAGAETYFEMWPQGLLFASLLLAFLAVHEFGHYFAAVKHDVDVTLPFFIPIPVGIGTMGAVIKIKEKIKSTTALFDVGIAGPIAGFIVSLIILLIGFSTLPEPDYIKNFAGHESVIEHIDTYGSFPEEPVEATEGAEVILLGNTLLYTFLASFFDNVPPMYEMYHYPFLFAGWLGLFFTALNLTPIGQLDGGHVLYSLIGYRKHRIAARLSFGFLTILAGIEAIPFLYTSIQGWAADYAYVSIMIWAAVLFFLFKKAFYNDPNWVTPLWFVSLSASAGYLFFNPGGFEQIGSLIWVVWSFFIIYFVKIEHPPVVFEEELTPGRKRLGWASMAVFLLCISPTPIYFAA